MPIISESPSFRTMEPAGGFPSATHGNPGPSSDFVFNHLRVVGHMYAFRSAASYACTFHRWTESKGDAPLVEPSTSQAAKALHARWVLFALLSHRLKAKL